VDVARRQSSAERRPGIILVFGVKIMCCSSPLDDEEGLLCAFVDERECFRDEDSALKFWNSRKVNLPRSGESVCYMLSLICSIQAKYHGYALKLH
jgi:hypothetical protein